MALRIITQARPEDLEAAQWALIAAVEETAASSLGRYVAPAATDVLCELLAAARNHAGSSPARWASLLGQYLHQLVAQLQAGRDSARGEAAGRLDRISVLEKRIESLLAEPLREEARLLAAGRDAAAASCQRLSARIIDLERALTDQQEIYDLRLANQEDESAELRALIARQQLKLNGLLAPEG